MSKRHVNRSTRKKLIAASVERLTRDGEYPSVSVHDIAHDLGLVPSTYMRNIVYELVADGVLHIRWVKWRSNVNVARITLSRQWIDSREPMQQRLVIE
jgi:hypothetical protein